MVNGTMLVGWSTGTYVPLTPEDWRNLERQIGYQNIPLDIRDFVEAISHVYASLGSLHTKKITKHELQKKLKKWTEVTKELRRQVWTGPLDADDDDQDGGAPETSSYSGNPLALQELARRLDAASKLTDDILATLSEIPSWSKIIAWEAWAVSVRRAFASRGLHASASSEDKTVQGSPFVRLIDELQQRFPIELRRGSYGSTSVSTFVKAATRKFNGKDSRLVLFTLILHCLGGDTSVFGDLTKYKEVATLFGPEGSSRE